MNALYVSVRQLVRALALVLLVPTAVPAQLISLKTVPIAAGDQFMLFPSQNLGMGGAFIALNDMLLDPFVNPAKGSRIEGARLFTSPVFYNVSDGNGSGRSLSAGLLFGSNEWFGAAMLSLQELEFAERGFGPIFIAPGQPVLLSDKSASNVYAFGMAGTKLRGSNVSIGGSVFWAGLDALEGVDLLYAGSQSIDQSGHLLDLRLGLLGELEGERTYEAVLLFNQLDMTHDVTYVEWLFEEPVPEPSLRTRVETNLDRTNTWGVHLGYVQPLAADGWRIGGIFTTNYKSHPKIPNYEIMNIPRDPGDSWALNLGLGVSRSAGMTTFAADLILEPIWSETWAEAEEPVTTASGMIIPAGWKTVENEFRFTNALVRVGFGVEYERVGFQLGMQVYSIDYRLEQTDHVQETKRKQEESWYEWTPTWSFALTFPEVQIRYTGRLTTGTGLPGVAWTPTGTMRAEAFAAAGDFIVAPSGPLTLQDASVTAHQLAVVIPIGG